MSTKPCKQRLSLAKNWIPTYEGKNLVRGYRKKFKVSMLVAANDLKKLGIEVSEQYIDSLKRDEESRRVQKEKRKLKNSMDDLVESDYYFQYIAGYTENGFAYGITWEEAEELQIDKEIELSKDNDNDLPF